MKRTDASAQVVTVNPSELGIYSDALIAQAETVKWWQRFAARSRRGDAAANNILTRSTPERNEQLAKAFGNTLNAADTFYVHDTIARFIGGSIASVPAEAVLRTEELPARCGFMYFAEPIEMPCHAPDRHVDQLPADWREHLVTLHSGEFHQLRALAWDVMDYGGVRVAVDPSMAPGETRLLVGDSMIIGSADEDPRLQITSGAQAGKTYGMADSVIGSAAAVGQRGLLVRNRPEGFRYEGPSVLVQTYVGWQASLRPIVDPRLGLLRDVFAWNEGTPTTEPLETQEYIAGSGGLDDFAPAPPMDGADDLIRPVEGRQLSINFARRLLVAIASFMHQQLPAETRTAANGLTRKRYAGTPYEGRTIRVVHMRKRAPVESYNPKVDGEPVRKMHGHWMVRAHPRNQWYRSLGPATDPNAHRLRWIQAFDKGNRALPLKPSRTLFAVTR